MGTRAFYRPSTDEIYLPSFDVFKNAPPIMASGPTRRRIGHSWLSRTRARLPLELHERVFTWALHRLSEHGLIKGERIGVNASTLEANAALCRATR